MNKKIFFAQQWLNKDIESIKDSLPFSIEGELLENHHGKKRFPTFINQHKLLKPTVLPSDKFSPLHCFVPGWKGDSLKSKDVLSFEKLFSVIQHDIKNELFKTKDFPKTIKLGLYNEFLSYSESLGLNFDGLDDLGRFWQLIDPDKLSEEPKLEQFIDIYSYRVATITFFKLRFIASLLDQCGIEINEKALLYPTSFLSQIFKKGSLKELNSRALESNLYSWYRPNESMKDSMREILLLSRNLSLTEIIKHVSHRTQVIQDQQKVYSHALSHISFGLFLNSLQINYPMWLEATQGQSSPQGNLDQQQIISCKFFGDYLESLSLSHWLAQENNREFHWDEMLCPDFKGKEFISGTFSKICNELQFLTFLANKAQYQGEKPIDYICKIMSGHFKNRKSALERQGLLLEENPFYTSTYDRVVLNLFHFPKNNPQHYLMNQISDQVQYLKPNGFLFVLSSKRLFVPSLRERLEPVLKELKTEAIFDLENVKGKGELGSYIYIFRKKQNADNQKQLCSYFRVTAELENFQQFSSITEHLRSFYLAHLTEVPPMAHMDFPDFKVEFFQEAVVNGMLIHSASDDASRITHPAYFKGLLDNCVPLDTLFEIRSLVREDQHLKNENALNLGLQRDLSYFLVVDFRQSDVNLELHPMDTFRSIYSDYGQTQCSYFQLISKVSGLNPNILRNYFMTPVGKQVTNLTFTGGPHLVKGCLSKFLVPKVLTETENLPVNLLNAFKLLEMNEESLLETSPVEFIKTFKHIDQVTRDLFPRYACEILTRFSNLERTLQSLIWKMDDSRFGHKVSFSNPIIEAQLVQKPTRPIYPDNDDIFLEFVEGTTAGDIHETLSDSHMRVTHEGELKLHSLELICGNKTIVRIHAEEVMVLFLHFILSHATNVPVSKILKAVHVPTLSDLKQIIETTSHFKVSYQELLSGVQKSIMDAFRLHVSPKRNQ